MTEFQERKWAISERWRRRHGIGPRIRPVVDRLLEKREVDANGCWLWTGSVNPKTGYASTTIGSRGTRRLVHRLSYEHFVGPVPDGMELDHLCRVRRCFNPAHLEPVTRRENVRRGSAPARIGALNASKTHCKHGHPFDAENTRTRPDGSRKCRQCAREHDQRRRARERHG